MTMLFGYRLKRYDAYEKKLAYKQIESKKVLFLQDKQNKIL